MSDGFGVAALALVALLVVAMNLGNVLLTLQRFGQLPDEGAAPGFARAARIGGALAGLGAALLERFLGERLVSFHGWSPGPGWIAGALVAFTPTTLPLLAWFAGEWAEGPSPDAAVRALKACGMAFAAWVVLVLVLSAFSLVGTQQGLDVACLVWGLLSAPAVGWACERGPATAS